MQRRLFLSPNKDFGVGFKEPIICCSETTVFVIVIKIVIELFVLNMLSNYVLCLG